MKNKETKTPVIKGYKFDGDKIVINYGLFKKERIANTVNNVRALNAIMDKQLSEEKRTPKYYRNAQKGEIKSGIISFAIAAGLTLLSAPVCLIAIPSVFCVAYLSDYCYNVAKEKQANKMQFYKTNKDALNEIVPTTESDQKTLNKVQGAKKKTIQKILEEKQTNDKVFTVNSVRKMDFESLLNIRQDLLLRKYINLTEEKPMTLSL